MRLPTASIIPVRRWALNTRRDRARRASNPRPSAQQARGGRLLENGLCGLVLDEARVVFPALVQRQYSQIDYVEGVVHVILRLVERLEV